MTKPGAADCPLLITILSVSNCEADRKREFVFRADGDVAFSMQELQETLILYFPSARVVAFQSGDRVGCVHVLEDEAPEIGEVIELKSRVEVSLPSVSDTAVTATVTTATGIAKDFVPTQFLSSSSYELALWEVSSALESYIIWLERAKFRGWRHRFLCWIGADTARQIDSELLAAERHARGIINRTERHQRSLRAIIARHPQKVRQANLLEALCVPRQEPN